MDFASLNVSKRFSFFFFYVWYFYDFQGLSVAHPMSSLVIMRGAFLPASVVMAWTTVMMEATRGAVVSSVFHFSSFCDAQSIDPFFLFDDANFFIRCSEYLVVLFEP